MIYGVKQATCPNQARLTAIGWPLSLPEDWQALCAAHPAARPARVIEQHRSGYVVAEHATDVQTVESLPEWVRPRCDPASRAAVGDWVLIEDSAEKPRIVALLPRWSTIKRAAAGEHYKQQLIAANVDTAFVVTGLDADFNPRRIERYLLLLKGGGVEPVVVLTKQDIAADAPAAREALAALAAQAIAVCSINARDANSVRVLAPWLTAGRTVVLVGSSGAGKSTLSNTLLGEARMRTGAVRAHDARGRHTTTYRALLALPGGACLIDTPGMRELKPTGEEQLDAAAFADIAELAGQCRFRDCRHDQEPGCALQAAVACGALEPARFANYLKLRDELAVAADTLAQRQAENAAGGRGRRRFRR
ncbi:ribosome small subunit-dependent GTPase A [Lysobacteraceae bacterium NML75-0749]|nr:ribosome small subunit-dependent GTPase A [Xanthomonadaceae bacterium NML75-0749]PJK03732.1 ribosome small subunit-dependent GTPase A [Xanthomonadaceae bacterium NML91-0268]